MSDENISTKSMDENNEPDPDMKAEIEAAVGFLTDFLVKSPKHEFGQESVDLFRRSLQSILYRRYNGHWNSAHPLRGSGFRCLRINGKLDPLVEQAAHACRLPLRKVRHAFPAEVTIWVDPGNVSVRFGEEGSVGELYESALAASRRSEGIEKSKAERSTPLKFYQMEIAANQLPSSYQPRGSPPRSVTPTLQLLQPPRSITPTLHLQQQFQQQQQQIAQSHHRVIQYPPQHQRHQQQTSSSPSTTIFYHQSPQQQQRTVMSNNNTPQRSSPSNSGFMTALSHQQQQMQQQQRGGSGRITPLWYQMQQQQQQQQQSSPSHSWRSSPQPSSSIIGANDHHFSPAVTPIDGAEDQHCKMLAEKLMRENMNSMNLFSSLSPSLVSARPQPVGVGVN